METDMETRERKKERRRGKVIYEAKKEEEDNMAANGINAVLYYSTCTILTVHVQ